MGKSMGTKYKSMWDWSTWLMLGLICACCIVSYFMDDGILPSIVSLAVLAFILLTFLSIYYRIDGNRLMVYTFFIPKTYPIDRIVEIRPTKSSLSSPATSLTHRLAISFSDRKIPLVISPVRQEEFTRQLLAVNPEIKHFLSVKKIGDRFP